MDIHDVETLPVLWRRWTEIVAGFASREPGRFRLDPVEYEAFHRALLRACQDRAHASDAQRAAWLDSLEFLVEPWITAGSLEQADQELLTDVLARCRSIDREMNGRDWTRPVRRHPWLLVVAIVCLIIPPVLVVLVDWGTLPLADVLHPGRRWIRTLLRETSALGWVYFGSGLLGVAFVFWAFWALSGPSRR
jgi:hypothetical protein